MHSIFFIWHLQLQRDKNIILLKKKWTEFLFLVVENLSNSVLSVKLCQHIINLNFNMFRMTYTQNLYGRFVLSLSCLCSCLCPFRFDNHLTEQERKGCLFDVVFLFVSAIVCLCSGFMDWSLGVDFPGLILFLLIHLLLIHLQ